MDSPIHLTLTGVHAGTTLCGHEREVGEVFAHAVYAPLHSPEYRAKVCPKCLMEYALSYEEDELSQAPDWVQSLMKFGAQGTLF